MFLMCSRLSPTSLGRSLLSDFSSSLRGAHSIMPRRRKMTRRKGHVATNINSMENENKSSILVPAGLLAVVVFVGGVFFAAGGAPARQSAATAEKNSAVVMGHELPVR